MWQQNFLAICLLWICLDPCTRAAGNDHGWAQQLASAGESFLGTVESKVKKAAADPKNKDAAKGCTAEAKKYCKSVAKDPKALYKCLKENEANLGPICKAEMNAFWKANK